MVQINFSRFHIIILWNKAIKDKDELKRVISEEYNIIDEIEIVWSLDKTNTNFSRFYDVNLPEHISKEDHVGYGKSIMYIVKTINFTTEDFEITSFEKILRMKNRLRELTGGGHKVHASNNLLEARRNFVMLTGVPWDKYLTAKFTNISLIPPIIGDTVGCNGWSSLEELFFCLNESIEYVVLKNGSIIDECKLHLLEGDIDILVRDKSRIKYILNPFRIKGRLHYVSVNNQIVIFDIYDFSSFLIDRNTLDYLLSQKLFSSNVYVLEKSNEYFFRLYNHLFYCNKSHSLKVEKIEKLELELLGGNLSDEKRISYLLDRASKTNIDLYPPFNYMTDVRYCNRLVGNYRFVRFTSIIQRYSTNLISVVRNFGVVKVSFFTGINTIYAARHEFTYGNRRLIIKIFN